VTATVAKSSRRGHRVAALVTAMVAVGVAITALPGAEPTPHARTPLLHRAVAAPAVLLRAAAAAAADQPPPPAFAGYRYTEVRERWRWADFAGRGPEEVEQTVENWVDRRWAGRVVSQRGSVIVGGPKAPENPFVRAGERDYSYGDGPLADLDVATLPTDARTLREFLLARFEGGRWAPGEAEFGVPYSVTLLLGTANTTPEQRAALWGVLALTPGLRPAHGGLRRQDLPDALVVVGRRRHMVAPADAHLRARCARARHRGPPVASMLSHALSRGAAGSRCQAIARCATGMPVSQGSTFPNWTSSP
jgi:hypothetical protein